MGAQMKILGLFVVALMVGIVQGLAQNPSPTKDWTLWAPVQDKWAEFLVITNLRGGNKTPEQLAKTKLKSLKVDCQILGRLSSKLPPELKGVKSFRILYTEYGKFQGMDDFSEDFVVVPYSGNGQYLRPVTVTRPATEFDVAEASRPLSVTEMTITVPAKINSLGLGLDPSIEHKLRGHKYFVAAQWRRKGSTVELMVKDYRPTPQTGPSTNP